jgi:hypothetical protein
MGRRAPGKKGGVEEKQPLAGGADNGVMEKYLRGVHKSIDIADSGRCLLENTSNLFQEESL